MTRTKTLLSLTAAGAVAIGGVVATSQPAKAFWWVAPAIIGGAALSAGAVATAASGPYPYGYGSYAYEPGYTYAPGYAYEPAYAYEPEVYAQATRPCRIVRERVNGHLRRVRVCR